MKKKNQLFKTNATAVITIQQVVTVFVFSALSTLIYFIAKKKSLLILSCCITGILDKEIKSNLL